MLRLSRFLSLTILLVSLLACNLVTEPMRDAQNLAETAQSAATLIPVETLQALPSAAPTIEALASALPDFGSMLNPQGTPVQEWRGIPIMPQATTGQEFSEDNTYSFRANVTVEEVQNFYNEELSALGWDQPFSFPSDTQGGLMTFEKDGSILTITITASEDSVLVLLLLA